MRVPLCACTFERTAAWLPRSPTQHRLQRLLVRRHITTRCAVALLPSPAQQAKQVLLDIVSNTRRGSSTSKLLRGEVEEAQIAVESFSGPELNYDILEGRWKLVYTTAADVVCRAHKASP